ncbi:hypothetical protein HI113_45940, partial [Corallococcus exiguus]|uniref:hypothetical protein n=1 Tax=Corallococcus exiguus TaxID=83462 RepID=UPI0014728B7D
VVFRDAAGAATGYAITYSNGANVITQFYSLAGVKGSALQLTSNGLNDGDYISATAMQDGRVAVVYSEWSPEDNGDIYLRVVSANGTATDKLLLNARSVLDHTGQQYTPKVTEMADGRLSVTWYDGSLGRG